MRTNRWRVSGCSRRSAGALAAATVAVCLLGRPLAAQVGEPGQNAPQIEAPAPTSPPTQATTDGRALNYSLIQLIRFGGMIGYLIIILSVVAVALMIDDALLLRRKVLMPPEEVDRLRLLVEQRRYDEVDNGEPRASFVGAVTARGLSERSRGYDAVVKAMEDAGDEFTGKLLRRLEYLNMIATVTPMLGLLGTVVGMVKCFNQISIAAGGVDPRLLAAGIFQALMTTVMGLIVAIPSLFAFGVFRNRLDALVADATAAAEELIAPLRPGELDSRAPARLSRI